MAVVVDKPFFDSFTSMDRVTDLSNADIAWFIMTYKIKGRSAELSLDRVHFTTLERAVEGLTAGQPVSLGRFEGDISKFLAKEKHKKKIMYLE